VLLNKDGPTCGECLAKQKAAKKAEPEPVKAEEKKASK